MNLLWWKLLRPVPSLPPSSVSPLNELLEDLSSQAVADLHYVWLQKGRHTNSRSDSGFFQWEIFFFFFWQMNAQTSVDDIKLSLTLLKHLLPSFFVCRLRWGHFTETYVYCMCRRCDKRAEEASLCSGPIENFCNTERSQSVWEILTGWWNILEGN